MPQLCIDTLRFKQLCMRTTLNHVAILENKNLITVVDRTQPMCDKHACPLFFLDNAIDVL